MECLGPNYFVSNPQCIVLTLLYIVEKYCPRSESAYS